MINKLMTRAPTLTTSRLVLRAHTLDDLADSAAMWANHDVVRYIGGRPFSDMESWSRLLRYTGHWALMQYGYWVIEDRQSGQFLGEAGFADHRRETQPSMGGRPEAGWALAPHAQGRGYAREALECMFLWADDNLKSLSTVCIIHPDHARSVRLAREFGFKQDQLINYMQEPALFMVRLRVNGH